MKKHDKDKKEYTWKHVLLDKSVELILALLSIGIGFGIALLLPRDTIKYVPAELFFLVGGYILLAVSGIVALTVYLVKRKKRMNDMRLIYNSLKKDYPLTLMTVSQSTDKKTADIPIIKGKTSEVAFELLKDGQAFSFSIEYFERHAEERYSKVCVSDVDGAIEKIKEIMSGTPV